jgi:hypothetical protein
MKALGFITFTVTVLLVCPPRAGLATEETLTNASVIELHNLDLGDAVVIEKIKTSKCEFDVSTDGLKQLKEAGVTADVIKAMITAMAPSKASAEAPAPPGDPNDPAAPHEPGIWLYEETDGKRKMTKLAPSVFAGTKSGGAWGVAWGGTAKTRAVLSGPQAALQISDVRPTFYFYFEETQHGLSRADGAVTTPNEFFLSQMEVRKTKNERRLVVGKVSWGGSSFGPDQKATRPFDSEKIAPGVYKVVPTRDLDDGEYCFLYTGSTPVGGFGFMAGGANRAFDFGIRRSGSDANAKRKK